MPDEHMIPVLMVDDQPPFLDMAKRLLEKGGGIEVSTAGSTEKAMEALKEKTFDVIISDYDMPGMNGVEFLRALRSRGNDTPFILYASKGRGDATIDAMKSGAEFYLQKSSDPQSQFTELRFVIEEIAEHKRMDDALRQREKDFHAIVDKNADAMVVLDKEGVIQYLNPAAITLFNLPESEMVGKMMGFPIILKEPVDMYVVRGFKEFTAAEMRMVEVEWEGQPSYLISFRDVTGHVQYEEDLSRARDELEVRVQERTLELSRANEKLREEIEERTAIEDKLRVEIEQRTNAEKVSEESKAKAEFYLDLMAHDINNLNQVALGYLELALESSDMGEMRTLMKKPFDAIWDASEIIRNVKKLQQISSGESKKDVTANIIDLCNVISQVRSQYSGVKGRTVRINLEAPHLCFVMADNLIVDVFSNIVGNAIKHSNPDKPLNIDIKIKRVKERGREYYLCAIEDNGPGIPDWIKDKIFSRSQRGSTKAHGKGLGLYIVKSLVEDYHGNVWVEDRVPGDYTKGAKFVVLLPSVEK